LSVVFQYVHSVATLLTTVVANGPRDVFMFTNVLSHVTLLMNE